jgi:hypothetical protein
MFGSRKTGFFTTSGAGGGSSTNSQNLSETLGYGNQSSTAMSLVDDIKNPSISNDIYANLISMQSNVDNTLLYYRADLMKIQDANINANNIYANKILLSYNDEQNIVTLKPPVDTFGNLNLDRDTNLYFPSTGGVTGLLALNNTNLVDIIRAGSYDINGYYTPVTNINSTYIVVEGDSGNVPIRKILLNNDIGINFIKLYFLIKSNIGIVRFQADTDFTIYGRTDFDTSMVNQTGMITIIKLDYNFYISNII